MKHRAVYRPDGLPQPRRVMHLKDDGDDVFAFNFLSAQRVMSALSDISAAGLDAAGDSRLQTFPAPPRLREAELRGSSTLLP